MLEVSVLLGCGSMSVGDWYLMFEIVQWSYLQRSEHLSFTNTSILDDETTMMSRNAGHQTPSGMVPHSRRKVTSTAPLEKPKTLITSCLVETLKIK